ncbi:BamA/TamA family outer membrane protein [Flavobacteriaceae bacterium TP-CH-4]|uniref:BamA/TamA family outer membrane protein n=1 Tax=Pelagihabitans pacificus TaxID=2696054 RepID=A0A967AW29_9FLAO|nr:BamA/TamA family outer membrane protein [Pelagihabitans pacificus]NHF60997.1 BamA/TamA family outer membrane protein [Pelagihabitans pacificus]
MISRIWKTLPPLYLMVLCLVQSCSVQRFVPENERLYGGADIQIEKNDSIEKIPAVRNELELLLQPQPNTSFLGMRLPLFFHFKAQRERPGFLYRWLNKNFGEEPVYFSDVDPQRMEGLMRNRLDNHGFFYSTIQSEIDSTHQAATVSYRATIPQPYVMERYQLESDSSQAYKAIGETLGESLLEKGDRFDLALMKSERERIDNRLKQQGYYNFNPDFLIFEADTNQYRNRRFDLFLRFKKEVPQKAKIPYEIGKITVYPEYKITNDTTRQEHTVYEGIDFVQDDDFFKPKRLAPYILLKEGQRYNAETARLTSNRLSGIGSYKYANIQFKEVDTTLQKDSTGLLNVDIFLSPLTKRSLRAELKAITKSNGFTGPGISVTYSNRNLFHGGETLNINGSFSYEAQLTGGNNEGLNSIVGGLKTELVIPRLVPFSPSRFRYAVPKTRISLGGDFLNRSKLYTLTSINSVFGYTWNANRFVYHELNPISVNYTNLANTTAEFDTILDENPFLRTSFEQQFIAGLNYGFTYNELVDGDKTRPIFFSANWDIAGNLLNLVSGGKREVFGLEYAQYAKLDADFRYYWKWGKQQTLVSRLYAGWGLPFGNSVTLPFAKQFFSGGPYSVRAFQIRSLGPGTFQSTDTDGSSFFDQSGNLRLEANLEYRFPIWSYLKGAFFADAGNVWLTYDIDLPLDEPEESRAFNEELIAKGRFGSNWVSQLGVGVGLGLRVDIQSFVIRLDVASPWRVPYLPENERSRIPFFGSGDNNLVWNFAIGYPF